MLECLASVGSEQEMDRQILTSIYTTLALFLCFWVIQTIKMEI